MSDTEFPPHVASEFYLWLWYRSETGGGTLAFEDSGSVDFWVEDRLSFRSAGEEKVSAVLTGERPSASPEARAALRGGKVLRELKLALRREEREYLVSLRGPAVEIAGAKIPSLVKSGEAAEILYERMFLYEELTFMIGGLFRAFAEARCGDDWERVLLPRMRALAAGQLDAPEEAE